MHEKTRNITYGEAIAEALHEEMRRDPRVFVYGIDVGDHAGVWGTTRGLQEEFGPERCFSTPLSEDALLGFGIGAAIKGLRPVNVHIRADFLLLAVNQLVNIASSWRYGTGGKMEVPLTIRVVVGRSWGQGFQHSKSLFGWFTHIPGIKVVAPTTPQDAKGLLSSAIRDQNPVVVFEHRLLYFQEEEVPEGPFTIPFGEARKLREGKDITIVATSWMNVEAVHAADVLKKKQGVEVEVIDPRTIAPLNDEPIIESVKKTGHCIIVDCDWLFCGISAELAARIYEKCGSALKSPVERMGFAHTPCPTTRPLENEFYPDAKKIVRVIEKKLGLSATDLTNEKLYGNERKFKGPF